MPETSTPPALGATPRRNLRVAGTLAAIIIGAACIYGATALRSKFQKPQMLSNVEPSIAALAAKASAAPVAPAASAAPAAQQGKPVIELPKPETALAQAQDAPVIPPSQIDERINRLDVLLSRTMRELNTSREEVKTLEQRIAKLEAALEKANEQVQALSDKAGKAEKAAQTAAPDKEVTQATAPATERAAQAKQVKKVAAAKRRKRTARAAARKPAVAAAAVMSSSSGHKQQGQGALLAVDMWDGKPSAVIGTGIPGDRRVRVLQPGEQLAGVALVSADARRGSATVATGTGVFTMFVDE